MTAVELRSYSPIVGAMALERLTHFAGPAFRQRPRRFILVTAIGIGIEQADCHRLDTPRR